MKARLAPHLKEKKLQVGKGPSKAISEKSEEACEETSESISHKCTFRIFFFLGGWQAVSFGGGVTVMEKREILVGWVTKVCLKCTKRLG